MFLCCFGIYLLGWSISLSLWHPKSTSSIPNLLPKGFLFPERKFPSDPLKKQLQTTRNFKPMETEQRARSAQGLLDINTLIFIQNLSFFSQWQQRGQWIFRLLCALSVKKYYLCFRTTARTFS